jgi:Na+:H+ antiporter, NhaA family
MRSDGLEPRVVGTTLAGSLRRRGPKFAARLFVGPIQAFVATESASGVALLAAAVLALVWANSPGRGSYHDLWSAKIGFDASLLSVRLSLLHAVNDGLMAVFFFVAGLEIKRELLRGELAHPRRAALPVAAALGGMIVPALIYAAWNGGGEGARGWGIPVATDIAFSLGVLALLGRRAPFALKAFLLALAIADDLGAIAVIALFYSDSVALVPAAWAMGLTLGVAALGYLGVRSVTVYVIVGALLWLAVFKTGIHATVAGVVLAALTPIRPYYDPGDFESASVGLVERVAAARTRGDPDEAEDSLRQIEQLGRDSVAPLDRLERALHPWVSYAIVPLFALANAGVSLSSSDLHSAGGSAVSDGIAMGLILGKPVGIVLFAWVALKLGLGALPRDLRFLHVLGAGMVAGIGFTVSLFVTGLAFENAVLQDQAKIGILAGSLVAGLAGFFYLWFAPGQDAAEAAREAAKE